MIDLRSDTVTKPSAGMRAAMAAADVGDDVFGEDPTVNRLQERGAALLGKEAALFVTSGTMANQVCLKVLCQPGDDVIVGEGTHTLIYESGAAAALAGVQFSMVGKDGLFTAAEAEGAYKGADNAHNAPTRLIVIENTHNRGGGAVWPQKQISDVAAVARKRGLSLHLDGARLCNAAIASGVSPADIAAPFDTATLCFSKGLGAPVGSIVAGSRALMARALRFRKMLGGGMRQAGILAAAALYALDNNIERLADDHANARLIAERLASVPGLHVDLSRVETNIVMVDLEDVDGTEAVARLRDRGVLCLAPGPKRLRFVTHLDVDRRACEQGAKIVAATLGRV